MVFSLRVNPQPFDFINEFNLRTFKLAPMNDDVANSVLVATASAVMAPLNPTTQDGVGRLTTVIATSGIVFFACRSETTELLAYRSKTAELPILMNRTSLAILTLVELALASRRSSPRN